MQERLEESEKSRYASYIGKHDFAYIDFNQIYSRALKLQSIIMRRYIDNEVTASDSFMKDYRILDAIMNWYLSKMPKL